LSPLQNEELVAPLELDMCNCGLPKT